MIAKGRSPLNIFAALCAGLFPLGCNNDKPPQPLQKSAADAGVAPKAAAADVGVASTPAVDLATPAAPAKAVAPACEATIAPTGEVQIKGKPAGITLAADAEGRRGGVRVFASATPDVVLVAVQPQWHVIGGATPDGKLWEVPCEAPGDKKPFMEVAGADFGNAAQSRDGALLFFTSPQGIGMLDLATRQWQPITDPPEVPKGCQAAQDKPLKSVDVVTSRAVTGNKLVFERGGPCGKGGAWIAQELHLIRPDQPSKREIRAPQPVSAVAIDAGGEVWIGDAGRCDVPGVNDPQTHGVAWVSKDGGQSWEKRPIQEGGKAALTAPRNLFADAKTPGRVLAYTARCALPDKAIGGSLYQTRDAGKTWKKIALPPEIPATAEGQGLHAVEVAADDLDRIVVWGLPHKRWETADGGKTWNEIGPGRLPRGLSRLAQNDRWIFRVSSNGLLRKDIGSKRLLRVFPPEEAPKGADPALPLTPKVEVP